MKDLKSNVKLVGRVFLNRYFLFVLNGFLLAAALLFYMHDAYEHNIVTALSSNIKRQYSKYNSEDSLLIGGLRLTHYLEERRVIVFGPEEINDGYTGILQPLTNDLLTAKGACGSYALVLGSILKDIGFKIRFAQMKVDNTWGGHIIIEAKTKLGWVALDPSFNLAFVKEDGTLASFQDVHSDWNYFKNQLPDNYKREYAYDDVRYTNWEKIPVILPGIRFILNHTIGKEATNEMSIRVFFLRKYRILYYIMLSLYLYSWYRIVRRYARKRNAVRKTLTSQPGKRMVYRRA